MSAAGEAARRAGPTILRSDPNPGLLRGTLHALYDLAWMAVAVLGSPWLLYMSLRTPGFGRMVCEQLGRGVPDLRGSGRRRILVHGVSVGEVKSAQPIVAAIEAAHPELEVVICTSTGTGFEVARKEFPGHSIVRFPSDISFVIRRFLRRVDPALVLLVELEIWPNFLRQCNRTGRPVAVVNGRITEGSHGRYLLFRKMLPQFNRISLICVQLPEYARRFEALDVDPGRIFVTGNVKVDGLEIGPVEPGEELRRLLGPGPGAGGERRRVLVGGSTHGPEERVLARLWREAFPEARLILVPRHPNRTTEVAAELAAEGVAVQLLSRLRSGEPPDPTRVALVDTIGELQRVYGLADVVFVGGTLIPHGGQNMLEPAAQGKAVVFGPYVQNFRQEAGLLVAREAGRQVADEAELVQALRTLLTDATERDRMGACGMQAVVEQRGATEKTLRALEALDLGGPAREPDGSCSQGGAWPRRGPPGSLSWPISSDPDESRPHDLPPLPEDLMARHLFTSESVSMGHPDKVADQVSDSILDALLEQDPDSRVACETLVTTGMCVIAGEITSNARIDYPAVAREAIKRIGYTDDAFGINGDTCAVLVSLDRQSPDISQGVTAGEGLYEEQGAGDQGLMFGYACDETEPLMPMAIHYSHRLIERQAELRQSGELPWLRPDAKSQVTVEYEGDKPVRIHTVVLSTQHDPDVDHATIKREVIAKIIQAVIPAEWLDDETIFHVNPTGRFVIGGPHGDAGLTGRKIIVDTYGGMGRHGGGAFSGKDASKVDRSAAYAARWVAKNIVAAGLATRCEVQLSYAIGVARPTSTRVDTFGTGSCPDEVLGEAIAKVFDLRPAAIIDTLDLKRPIYARTACHGHFGREGFTWEETNRVSQLQEAVAAVAGA